MAQQSLWGKAFTIEDKKQKVKKIKEKVDNPKKPPTKRAPKVSPKLSDAEKLIQIEEEVNRILGVYREQTICIDNILSLVSYIDASINNGAIAIDTETNNTLDFMMCLLMGGCIYTPGQKSAYIPVNHTDLSGNKLPNQITESQLKEQFQRLVDNQTKIIMHNGKFDYQVIKNTCDIALPVYWDTMLAARLLNENERTSEVITGRAGLKEQYVTKIDPSIEKYSIESLFKDIPYAIVPPALFALYAATDAYMTYRLYEWQLPQFEAPGMEGLKSLFYNVEMRVLIPTAEMELNGVTLDVEQTQRLSDKYHRQQDELQKSIQDELDKLKDKIMEWRLSEDANAREKVTYADKKDSKGKYNKTLTKLIEENKVEYDSNRKLWVHKENYTKSKAEQLEDPINLDSSKQLGILLYDILGVDPVYKNRSKSHTDQKTISVDEDAINEIYEKTKLPLLKYIIENRKINKLLGTYIDEIPKKYLCPKDGKIHCNYNQLGARTGRYSSDKPNMQNIPSKGRGKTIRMMFRASPGCVMLGSDFSAQEPRLLATYSQDPEMLRAYEEGKDLYAVIGTKVYKNNYEDNREHHPDGSPNPEGKARRTNCKSVLLGLMYGRGANSIAEQTGLSTAEAKDVINTFYKEFPSVDKWIKETQDGAHRDGYVEDLWGRRRRLPDINLKPYDVKLANQKSNDTFNPLLYSTGIYTAENNPVVQKYTQKINACRDWKEKETIKQQAKLDGVEIFDNGGYIAEAERQSVNSRIQGGAASMSKRAMIALYEDQELKDLGFRLLIMVHDELIGECPIQNADKVKEKLAYWMEQAGKPEVTLPMKCDVVTFTRWYEDEIIGSIQDYRDSALKKGETDQDVFNHFKEKYEEFTDEQIWGYINS